MDNTPASWAKEAVDWAKANKILCGDANGNLKLHSSITREEFCVMMKRYCDTKKQI